MNPPWPAPADLLPHVGPACLLDAVVEHAEDSTVCEATPYRDGRYDEGEGVTCLLAIELIAQAAAVHAALIAEPGPPRGGLLVAVQDARFTVPTLPLVPLRVRVTQTWGGADALAAFTGAVLRGEDVLATADLRVARA